MWYNIIPGFTIIVLSVGIPGYALYWTHYLVVGNNYRRSMLDRWDRMCYQRDERLTGSPYDVAGLESLPDKKPE